jgi:hypothetical protein
MTDPAPDEETDAVAPVGPAPPPAPAPPPTHLVARSAIAGVTVVVAVVAAVLALQHELPGELLDLVARYFEWLFGIGA